MYKKLPYFPTTSDVDKIFEILETRKIRQKSRKYNCWIKARDKLILYCGFYMGMRIKEVSGVNMKNIDFKEKTLKITTEFAKFGKERNLPVPLIVWQHLRTYAKKYKNGFPDGYLFHTSTNKRLTTRGMRDMFQKLLITAGLFEYYQIPEDPKKDFRKFRAKIHFHSSRHYCASQIYAKTRDPFAVCIWLGHKNPESSWVYVHESMAVKKEIMEKTFA